MPNPEFHTGREAFSHFMDEFMYESDRACIILASAEMEARLELLFSKFLITNSNLKKELFSFTGPLGSFSSRIKMAFALNLIDKDFYKLLDLFRSIRNKIVHKGVHTSLEDADIEGLCKEFLSYFTTSRKFNSWVFSNENLSIMQRQFRSAISFVIIMIEHTTVFVERTNVTPHSCNPEIYILDEEA